MVGKHLLSLASKLLTTFECGRARSSHLLVLTVMNQLPNGWQAFAHLDFEQMMLGRMQALRQPTQALPSQSVPPLYGQQAHAGRT